MEIFESGDLFEQIQIQSIFSDGKEIVDAVPLSNMETVLTLYQRECTKPDFDLKVFVEAHFKMPDATDDIDINEKNVIDHVAALWPMLTRESMPEQAHSSLIDLPNRYIVPGGRFREIYYWDSYFTMLGLAQSGHIELIQNMVDNFAYLIRKMGYIPNGNRTYYKGRSQPPFFSLMVELLCDLNKSLSPIRYLDAIEQEYDWWMHGDTILSEDKNAVFHTVLMPDGSILNRYYDYNNTPRPESYKEDVELAAKTSDKETMYRHIRAAAASGWDFSSRWFSDHQSFSTIHTTDIVPVDLNCLLFYTEALLAKWHTVDGNLERSRHFKLKSVHRKNAIQQYCWNEPENFYFDYDFISARQKEHATLAACFPLFTNIATLQQAEAVAIRLHKDFLKPGGLVTTLHHTGQQWDSPNGWAPLQWIAIKGLLNYNMFSLAIEIAQRWNKLNENVFKRTRKMMEKYNVENIELEAGGGEYPAQDGFGWTNGVFLQLAALIKK